MKQFFKFTLASILGFVIAGIILLVVVIIGITAAVSSATDIDKMNAVSVENNSILQLDLNQIITERASDNELILPANTWFFPENSIGINQIKKSLHAAAKDDKIKGVYIDISVASTGYASIKEIRDAIIEFKKSGKWVYAYANVYSQGAYYLASAADKIYLNPQGIIDWKGLYSESLFFKSILEKVGVEIQVIRGSNNKFKSAVEPFIATEMSTANKEQVSKYIGVLWDEMKREIEISRPALKGELNNIAEEYRIRSGQDAKDNNMVDGLLYFDEFKELLAKGTETKVADLKVIKLKKYSKSVGRTVTYGDSETPNYKLEEIAVIYANGGIGDGEGDVNNIGTNIAKALEEARTDENIKAIVLRVNSPGGSALMSDIIWREVVLAKKAKPLVVSMGDYAASGGYYISAAADKIFAQPNTITGSIGVFGLLPNAKKLMNENLGVYADGIETNKYARLGLPTGPLSEEEYIIIQSGVDNIYSTFLNVVANGRGIEKSYVDSIGQGRVWAGTDALNLGLVDQLGGLDDALAEAAKMANLEAYKIKALPKLKDPIEEIFSEFGIKSMRMNLIKSLAGDDIKNSVEEFNMLTSGKLNTYQARMPFSISVK